MQSNFYDSVFIMFSQCVSWTSACIRFCCANFRANQFLCPLISVSVDFCFWWFPRPSISASVNFRVRWFPRPLISVSIDFLCPLISESINIQIRWFILVWGVLLAMWCLSAIAYLLINPTVQLAHLPVWERAVSVKQQILQEGFVKHQQASGVNYPNLQQFSRLFWTFRFGEKGIFFISSLFLSVHEIFNFWSIWSYLIVFMGAPLTLLLCS